MGTEIFFVGVMVGVILTFVGLMVFRLIRWFFDTEDGDPVRYLDEPVSYEGKEETSFKVFQVLNDGALAAEISCKHDNCDEYNGKTVFIRGKDFYDGQFVNVKNPQRVGIYRYTTSENSDMSVPIIEGEME